eukprot:TRINITY_DN2262_c0_g1_i3.p1 TRINITY_DN2262_c0_g1~~TRINITY_DN2262_c0_g1_i3.p1  ORF type:complete len:372 (-),score=52.60 TRINITY_DN2262_c0_g1_i3:8-1123(-)
MTYLATVTKNTLSLFIHDKEKSEHSRYPVIEVSFEITDDCKRPRDLIPAHSPEELLYVVEFGELVFQGKETELVLATAGKSGLIYILRINEAMEGKEATRLKRLRGNSHEIYDLKFAPPVREILANLLLVVGKESTVHLWDIAREMIVYSFKSVESPRVDHIRVEWHSSGEFFAVCSLNSTFTFWTIDEDVKKKIRLAREPSNKSDRFHKGLGFTPAFELSRVHSGYADCFKFIGHFIISKGFDDGIKEWLPLIDLDSFMPCFHLRYQTEQWIWYTQFTLVVKGEKAFLVVGNEDGTIFIYFLDHGDFKKGPRLVYRMVLLPRSLVRKASLSDDLKTLFAISDNGRLYITPLSPPDILSKLITKNVIQAIP